jgi:hypothetical protein
MDEDIKQALEAVREWRSNVAEMKQQAMFDNDAPTYNSACRYIKVYDVLESVLIKQHKDTDELALWMLNHGFSTGHGDTMSGLLAELSDQVKRLRAAAMEADSMRYR